MSKHKIKTSTLEKAVLTSFNDTLTLIRNKYYNIILNKIGIKGVDYQQRDYILKNFWENGTIACFKLKGTEGTAEAPDGLMVYCQYAPVMYNTYDYPIQCTLINKRGVPFIPSGPQYIDKDVVIGFCNRNKKSIRFNVDYYGKKIALIESVIQTQLLGMKMPFLFATTPENKEKMENLWNEILGDNPSLFIDPMDLESIKVLITATNFNIDKLKALKDDAENELRETLGLDNLGVHEKKEHLINSEVKANDEITDDSSNIMIDCLNEFALQVQKVFKYPLSFYWKESEEVERNEEENMEKEEKEEREE